MEVPIFLLIFAHVTFQKNMTDNFNAFKEYVKLSCKRTIIDSTDFDKNEDQYYMVSIIRRNKDLGINGQNYHFRTFHISTLAEFDKFEGDIKKICTALDARAYACVYRKSKKKIHIYANAEMARRIGEGDFRKPWGVFSSVEESFRFPTEKRWVIDVDAADYKDYIDNTKSCLFQITRKLVEIINDRCRGKDEEKVLSVFPTKSGFHIITVPFNTIQWKDGLKKENLPEPSIIRNGLTLLYENIKKTDILA